MKVFNERGIVLAGAYVTERLFPGVAYMDHGARIDMIKPGEIDLNNSESPAAKAPAVAEKILASQDADMVSMARPLLADPEFVKKAQCGREDEINTCIACNQGCLDRVFRKQRATCLVNPQACYETELEITKTDIPKKIIVMGLGPAGLAFANVAAQRGHTVTAYDVADIGGQLNLALKIPGKQEFRETLRYFRQELEHNGVILKTGQSLTARQIKATECDAVIIAPLRWAASMTSTPRERPEMSRFRCGNVPLIGC